MRAWYVTGHHISGITEAETVDVLALAIQRRYGPLYEVRIDVDDDLRPTGTAWVCDEQDGRIVDQLRLQAVRVRAA